MLTITYACDGIAARTISLSETETARGQTAAIQSALDSVAGHAGATVTLSAGTFTITGTGKAADGALRVGSETTLTGAGMGATILKLADGSSGVTGLIRTDSGRTLADGTVTTTHGVQIANLSLDGNKANTSGNTDGFYCGPKPGTAQFDSDITLDHVEVANMSRYGIDPHEQTRGLAITNSVSHDNGLDGFTIDFCSDVLLAGNLAYANGRHGFNIVTGSSDVTLVDNVARDNGGAGITVQTGDDEVRASTHHITISGGLVENNGRAGIDVHQANDISIDGVTLAGNNGAGISLAGVDGASVTDNVITGVPSGSSPIRVAGYLQDFGDQDAANDRYIATRGVIVDSVARPDIAVPVGVAAWTYDVGAGNDSVTASAGRDVVAAGSGNDTVLGGGGDDLLYGEDGNDILDGGLGNDRLYGGRGDDTLKVGSGFDVVDGGAGFDAVDFGKFATAVHVDLGASGVEAMTSGTTSATAAGATIAVADLVSVEAVVGTSFADWIVGGTRADRLDGGGGYDVISGGGGDDTILGGAGNDTLTGGAGNDLLTGASGSDRFLFADGFGSDTVADFTRRQDKIDLTGIAAVTGFSQLTISLTAAGADVSIGADHVLLVGVQAEALTASDFLFHT